MMIPIEKLYSVSNLLSVLTFFHIHKLLILQNSKSVKVKSACNNVRDDTLLLPSFSETFTANMPLLNIYIYILMRSIVYLVCF